MNLVLPMIARLLILCWLIAAASPSTKGQEAVTQQRVDLLVAKLVSPNEAPATGRGPNARYPTGYDKQAQENVRNAYSALCRLGPAAFPYLFDHFRDSRYSLTADGGAADINFTVGSLCYAIVDLELQPYQVYTRGLGEPRNRPRRPHYATHVDLKDPQAARAWCQTRKGKSLRELQIEVLEWILAEESKDPATYPQIERDWIATTLKSLRESDKPLAMGIPWSK